ncbi:hypothetical protein SASPL_118983 [Salvia splendens]|uniref:Calponin-homology (CH) domain-containing protein n=1 Tax=Salvia splendens TaxID=180675 RepID=A0A8X8ZYX0_SALSN|nr:hypothetical protein SASPL_118983 [Salvia splendens]
MAVELDSLTILYEELAKVDQLIENDTEEVNDLKGELAAVKHNLQQTEAKLKRNKERKKIMLDSSQFALQIVDFFGIILDELINFSSLPSDHWPNSSSPMNPSWLDLVGVGAFPVAYGTSHVAFVHREQLGGGQIRGATVIAVARGSEKVRFFKSLGVDHVVDLSNEDMTQSVKGFLTARKLKGVDVLYDPVGGKLTKDSLKLLNWGEQILIIGFASGEVPAQQISLLLRIHRPRVLEDSLKELLSWLADGLLTVKISHTYSLLQANLAFAALKNREAIGKDAEAYAHLLNVLAPEHSNSSTLKVKDPLERAKLVLEHADKMGCKRYLTAKDMVEGSPNLNLAFVANIFQHRNGLSTQTKQISFLETLPDDAQTSREERVFRFWLNSLGNSPYIDNVFEDLRNGSSVCCSSVASAGLTGVSDYNQVSSQKDYKITSPLSLNPLASQGLLARKSIIEKRKEEQERQLLEMKITEEAEQKRLAIEFEQMKNQRIRQEIEERELEEAQALLQEAENTQGEARDGEKATEAWTNDGLFGEQKGKRLPLL